MKNITIVVLLFTNFLQGQLDSKIDTIYIDEDKKLSTKDLTLKKCKSDVFFCELIKYDSIIAFHTYYKYLFGSVDKLKVREYQSFIRSKTGKSLDTNSILVIDYRKYITSYNTYKKHVDSLQNVISQSEKIHSMTKKEYDNYRKRFYRREKKCSKKIERYNKAVPIYMYGENLDSDIDVEYFNKMIKDENEIFANDFFSENGFYKYLILLPNGNYFLKSIKATQNDFKDKDMFNLLKIKDWKPYLKEWNKRLMKLNSTVPSFSISIDYYQPVISCF